MPLDNPLTKFNEALERFYPKIDLPEPDANQLRAAVRRFPTVMLQDVWISVDKAEQASIPLPFGDRSASVLKQAVQEVLYERGQAGSLTGYTRVQRFQRERSW